MDSKSSKKVANPKRVSKTAAKKAAPKAKPRKKAEPNKPVFVILDMPQWKSKVLQFVARTLALPGDVYVITIEGTDFLSDGNKKYRHVPTGIDLDL